MCLFRFLPVALDVNFSLLFRHLRFLTIGLLLWCGFFGADKFSAKLSFSDAAVKVRSSNPLLI